MNPAEFPHTLKAITPTWLTSLGDFGKVVSLELEPISRQGMTSEVAYLKLQNDLGLKHSIIAKTSATDENTKARFSRFYSREVFFYHHLADSAAVKVPKCFYARSAGTEHLILLEDMNGADSWDTTQGVSEIQAERFVDLIAPLHGKWWQSPELDSLSHHLPRFGVAFESGYQSALHSHAELLTMYGTKATLSLGQTLGKDIQTNWNRQWREPQTVVQWDAHASNVLCSEGSNQGACLIDWQNCVVGNGLWDVARFCVLSLSAETRRTYEYDIVTHYVEVLSNLGVDLDVADTWKSYQCLVPLIFAQQFRFVSALDMQASHEIAWRDAIMPRVIAALHDTM